MTARSYLAGITASALLTVGLPVGAAPLKTAAALAAGKPVTIVCFGDSVTGVYYHTGGRRAWPDLLGLDLRAIYPAARLTIVNAGVSGNTTAQGLARMEADVLDRHPQLVVAMFGLNDVAGGVGPAEYRDHLKRMVARSRAAGAEVILLTPNSIYADDPTRPPGQVGAYAEIMRSVGREMAVPVADGFAAFEAVRAADPRAWEHLMSQTIHPNLRGHAVFAEEVAWTISGRRRWALDLPAPAAGWPRVLERLRAHEPVRIVAMKPYDRLIGPALQQAYPGAEVTVTAWDATGKSLPEIGEQAKTMAHFKSAPPDLVVLAVPASAGAADEGEFFRTYSEILNWTLPFGLGGGDYLAILPSAMVGALDPAQGVAEHAAREVLASKDLAGLGRAAGDRAGDLLVARIKSVLAETPVERALRARPAVPPSGQNTR